MNPGEQHITEFQPLNKEAIQGYRLIKEVGKGATGIVFKAEDASTGETVAIKVLYPYFGRSPDFINRLMREASLLKKLVHPNVVRGISNGKVDNRYYFVMEYIEGNTLADVIYEKGCLDEREAVIITLQVTKALEAASKLRIVHRDVKPANIIVTNDNIIKLMDFGLAKEEFDTSLTIQGSVLGTPIYISPEQACGEIKLDSRTDIYSLGITMYHMLTGEPPFVECNTSLLLTKKITDDVPAIKPRRKGLSNEICSIVHKMCEREKMLRHKNPEELIKDLDSYLAGNFSVPSPPPVKAVSYKPKTIVRLSKEDIANPVIYSIIVERKVPVKTILLDEYQVLFYEDEQTKDAYIILSGELEVLKAGRRIANIKDIGTFVGEMSTLLQMPRTATIRALQKCVLLQILEKDFQAFLKAVPEMSYHLAVSLAGRLTDTNNRLKEAQTRLAVIRDHFKFIQKTFEEGQ